jgi:hypothetical protein
MAARLQFECNRIHTSDCALPGSEEAVTGIAKPERSAVDDLEQPRRENAKLKMEIEILKNRPRGLPRPYA